MRSRGGPAFAFNFQRTEARLNLALQANDLSRTCKAIDDVLRVIGLQKVAEAAKINRTTLYRAFRLQTGTRLDLLVQILDLLGLELEVKTKNTIRSPSKARAALSITSAFASRDLEKVVHSFATVVRNEDNVTDLARKASLPRETLYRSFTWPRIPRLATLLKFLDALGMHFAVHCR